MRLLRPPALLRDVAFRRFWVAESVSLLGDQVSLLAIPLLAVLVLHATPVEMGYLVAVGLVPSLLLSLLAGAWVDQRGHRRRHMIASDVGRAAALLSLPVAAWLHVLALIQLYVVAFAIGSLDVVFFVAYSSLFVSLVKPHQYVSANTLLNGSRAVAEVGGQSLAGALVALLTAPVAVLADAASFVVSASFLSGIRPVEPPTSRRGIRGVADGGRFIATSSVVRRMLAVSATLNFFNYVFSAVFVLFVVRQLGVSPAALGLLLALGSTGMILGALVAGPLTRRVGVGRTYLLGCVAFPGPLLLIPAAPPAAVLTYVLVAAGEFVSGIGLMLFDITSGSLQAAMVPNGLRSRVTGAYRTVNYGVRPLGALAGGFAGAALGTRAALWIGGIGALACALWLIRSRLLDVEDLASIPENGTSPLALEADVTPAALTMP